MLLTTQQAKHWCRYLAALHTAIEAGSGTLFMPVSYDCTRVSDAITGCGTCYQCTKQLILRALHTSTVPPADVARLAAGMADSVFQYVTTLDERLNAPDGLGDDYTAMTSVQFATVMDWAANQPDPLMPPRPHSPLAQWPFESESPADYEFFDTQGRPRCQLRVQYADVPDKAQCALPLGHEEPCDMLASYALQNGNY